MKVVKRSGESAGYDVEKIYKVVEWATRDINGVSESDIEMNMNLSMRDGISTEEIHQILIKGASDLISEAAPCAAMECARRGESWKQKALTL